MLKTAEANIVELGEMLAGRELQLRRAGQAEVALRRELDRTREEAPDGETVRVILNYWKRKLGHPRAKSPLTGKRAQVVRKALRENKAEEIMEAIDGLALVPFVGDGGRRPTGTPEQRYDELEIALRDETSVRRFRGYAQRAKALADGAEWRKLAEVHHEAAVVADEYWRLLLEHFEYEDSHGGIDWDDLKGEAA